MLVHGEGELLQRLVVVAWYHVDRYSKSVVTKYMYSLTDLLPKLSRQVSKSLQGRLRSRHGADLQQRNCPLEKSALKISILALEIWNYNFGHLSL